jgi:PhoH-like ATPase
MPFDAPVFSGTVYVPDTSSLIENPDALDRLLTDGNVVVLLHQVVEELGRLQSRRTKSDGIRAAARLVTRKILQYRGQGRIHHNIERLLQRKASPDEFAPTSAGGVLAWEPAAAPMAPYTEASGDNLIVAGARRIVNITRAAGDSAYHVTVISEDSNVLLKCDATGIAAENLRYGKVDLDDPGQVYCGHEEIIVEPDVIAHFLESGPPGERWVPLDMLPGDAADRLLWNTGVMLTSADESILTRADPDRSQLFDLRFAQYWDRKRLIYCPRPILGFTPRDPLQVFAMEFLLDPTVQLVVLDGPAGSGKTRMMVAAALYVLVGQPTSLRFSSRSMLAHQTSFENGLVLLRPEHPSSQYELGYLPGDHESKLSPWLEPLLHHMRSLSALNEHDFVGELENRDLLHMLSTSMLRGLDIEHTVVLVDELQNGDRHLAKTLMSRFCETSKVVVAGCLDTVQIDNPYVDWRSNAVTRIKEAYRGFGPYVAQITLQHNYRGPISQKADEL